MKLVKVKKSGQLRVNIEPEELGFIMALYNKVSANSAREMYPPICQYDYKVDSRNCIGKLSNDLHSIMSDNINTSLHPSTTTGYKFVKPNGLS